ncbi:MAG: hypothetical protein K8R21_02165 [Leptospira sp.]|nr:hypothetical protein [Leptospira sp.]
MTWKLLFTSLPYVAFALGCKVILTEVLNLRGFLEFSDIALVLTGGIFLIGFMLAGTMADYKESEKIPSEIACSLETIEESLLFAQASKNPLGFENSLEKFAGVVESVFGFFTNKLNLETVFVKVNSLNELAVAIDKAGSAPIALRVINELSALRKIISRINVIKKKDFIAYGYALLELLLLAIFFLMIAIFKTILAEIVLVGFVFLIYVYMYRLIRDIDDPFDYNEDGIAQGSEVELFPFLEYRERLKKKIAK